MYQQFNFLLYLLFSLLLYIPFTVYGVDINNNRFNHIDSKNGLSSNQVTRILKSSDGYYWFGTHNGLNKYNGYDFKTFQSDSNNPHSISHDYIKDITEDAEGNLWIATLKGLNKYNSSTGKFQRFLSGNTASGLSNNRVLCLLSEGDYVWIGTINGLDYLNIKTGDINNKVTGKTIKSIVNNKSHLWLITNNELLHFNKQTAELNNYKVVDSKNTVLIETAKINNTLWIGTTNGLISFNLSTHTLNEEKHLLIGNAIISLATDSKGTLWIGSDNLGLFSYTDKTGKLANINTDTADNFYLQSRFILSLAIIKDQLWIGSDRGISYTYLKKAIQHIRTSGNDILDNSVWSISEGNSGKLWIGTHEGISNYSKKQSKHYKIKGRLTSVLTTDTTTWVTGWKGIYKYNDDNQGFDNILPQINEFNNIDIRSPYKIVNTGKNQFLIGTGYGLFTLNSDTLKSHELQYVDKNISKYAKRVYILIKYKDTVVLGTRDGLYTLNPDSSLIEKFISGTEKSPLDNAFVTDVFHNNKGFLWAATTTGVYKVKDRNIISHYTTRDGLADNLIYSIIVKDHIAWITTSTGLSAFRISNNSFQKLHLNNDQFNIEFNSAVTLQGNDGLLYFGSAEGLVYFKPEEHIESASPPTTTITAFSLFNKPILQDTKILPKTIERTKHLVLNHNQNMLTFEFSSINVKQPNHLYAYQLKGLNNQDEWIITDAKNRRATYTPGPGEYTFRVKSGWDKNSWSDHITEVNVTILPPWWQTYWAYAIYLSLLLLLIFSYIRIRTISLAKRASQLEQIVNERTEQLRISNSELQESHQQVQQLLERKNTLFINTSHELRTPLTLILGPINEVLKSCSFDHKQTLLLAKRNTERLIHMVDQLLELSRMNAPCKEEFVDTNFSSILSTIIHSVQSTLLEQSIQLNHNIEEDIYVSALPDALDILALNLISNAIKYTPAGGEIYIHLFKENSTIIFKVKDNGIGITPSEQSCIFEQFTRLDEARSRNIPGSGIGLALVKELVQLHQGNIKLISDIGQGAEFIITLPLCVKENQQSQNMTHHQQQSVNLPANSKSPYLPDTEKPILIPDTETVSPEQSKPSLLIVDDTVDMLNYLHHITAPHYNCTIVNNGKDALEYSETHIPDLIICDVMMPGMDGFEVLQHLRNKLQTCHIPFILLTAKGDKLSRIKAYESQVDDYISKPFDSDELLVRIANLINNRKQLRQHFSQMANNGEILSESDRCHLVPKDKDFISTFQNLIQENYHNADYRISELASSMCMSERALQLKLKSITEHSPLAYLTNYRLKKAITYLVESNLSIKSIPEKTGFTGSTYFNRVFKKHYGKTPSEYRKEFSRQLY